MILRLCNALSGTELGYATTRRRGAKRRSSWDRPEALDPRTWTLDPGPWTRTLVPGPQTPDPRPQTPDLRPEPPSYFEFVRAQATFIADLVNLSQDMVVPVPTRCPVLAYGTVLPVLRPCPGLASVNQRLTGSVYIPLCTATDQVVPQTEAAYAKSGRLCSAYPGRRVLRIQVRNSSIRLGNAGYWPRRDILPLLCAIGLWNAWY
eukprot:170949-Rhodomonas_salina.1